LDISVPTILSTSLTVETGDKPESTKQNDIDQIESEDLTETNPKIEEQDLKNLTIPAVLMSDLDYSTDSDDSSSIIENKIRNNITMAQTSIDLEFAAVEAGNCDFPFVPANQLRQTD